MRETITSFPFINFAVEVEAFEHRIYSCEMAGHHLRIPIHLSYLRTTICLPRFRNFRPSMKSSIIACQPQHIRAFSDTPHKMIAKSFQEAIAGRRSIYSLNKNTPISDEKLIQTIETITSNVPSSFNTQSTRLVVLLKDEHDKFWDLVEHVLQPNLTSDEQRQKTGGRLGMFKAAYGTVSLPLCAP